MKDLITKDIMGSKFISYIALSLYLTITLFIPVIIMFYIRRKTQPIRHRSPILILITLICNNFN